jgi:hypothetical protein
MSEITQDEQLGWWVLDPEGNVVSSGGVTVAEAAGLIAELIENAEE